MRSLPVLAFVLSALVVGCGAPPPGATSGPDSGDVPGGAVDGGAPTDGGAAVDAGMPGFDPVGVHVAPGPLCDIPPGYGADGGDPVNVPCAVEADSFLPSTVPASPTTIKVVAWNVEFGKAHATVLQQLQSNPKLKDADVLLLSEVSRDSLTSSPQRLNQARELAQALGMSYVFAVAWDRRELPDEQGEHGVAVLSRFPLGNVTQLRHTPLNDWWKEDKLYGGRITLGVDAWVSGRRVRLYASHLCTRGVGDSGRAKQGAEVRVDADLAERPELQIVGGDLNTFNCNPAVSDCTRAPAAEQVVEDFLAAPWSDGTAGWNGVTQYGNGFFPQRLDWLFYRGAPGTPGTGVTDATGSDHRPVYFTLQLP